MKMKIKYTGKSPFVTCLLLAIVFAFVGGWVANVVKLAGSDAFNGFVLLRAIGIFLAPLGAVLGWV